MMKRLMLFVVFGSMLSGCAPIKIIPETSTHVVEEKIQVSSGPLGFSQGYPAYAATTVDYKRKGKNILHIKFNEPVVVSVAAKPENWGFFQFPLIGTKPDGKLQVKWNMKPDAMSAYGKDSWGAGISADGGKTWKVQEKYESTGDILLPVGDRLEITTPIPIRTDSLNMPKPVGANIKINTYTQSRYHFYRLNDLPANCQAVYLKRLKKGETEWKPEEAALYDPDAVRHTTATGLLPVIWWGDMHIANDGSLIAGIYPGNFIKKDGTVDPKSAIFFYRSTDDGHSWRIQGRILYHADTLADKKGSKRMGFTEPAFEILKDGTFLCVTRTTDGLGNGPMYISYSKDLGKTWAKPQIVAVTGVLPRLLRLDNGVIVLASGRPGVQLRFCPDGKGKVWTDPFEILPYANEKEEVSCGYTGLLSTGSNSFMIVYSDFKYKTAGGNIRKAIKMRQVIVKQN
jgi:hypothetical protein